MSRVLLSQPNAAPYTNGLAGALAREGELALYVTGVAAAPATWGGAGLEALAQRWPTVRNRLVPEIPAQHLLSLPWVEGGARLAARAARRWGRALTDYDAMYLAHDRVVARLPWPRAVDVVYAYEDAALDTLARARRLGAATVCDLPLPHHAALERMWREEAERWPEAVNGVPPAEPQWKKDRKDAELRLADAVAVPSSFTRATVEEAGLRAPVAVTPFGFPVDAFAPKERVPDGPFTVLAVGSLDLRKGTPYLLEAWRQAKLPDARLRLIGRMGLSERFVSRYRNTFEHVPYLPKSLLGPEYRAADVLVLPTLGDGCPLVIQEAMCSGTPAITTRCGSGEDVLAPEREGWIVPERCVEALVELLRRLASRRDEVFRIGQAARARAERWPWTTAGAEAIVNLRRALASAAARPASA